MMESTRMGLPWGARDLIANNPDELELLGTEDAGMLQDMDYPRDLNR